MLNYQHGIAKTKKTILLPDSFPVYPQDFLPAAQGAYQHKQGGFWQVKIGYCRVYHLKSVTRIYEQIGAALLQRHHFPLREAADSRA